MTERRTFRGRGGPTDRRLPKHNARRRKHHVTDVKVTADDYAASKNSKAPKDCLDERQSNSPGIVEAYNINRMRIIDNAAGDDDADATEAEHLQEAAIDDEFLPRDNFDVDLRKEVADSAFIDETNHLMIRARKCRQTMQQAATSIAIPSNYEKHVLHAVLNCVNEWKSILKHYVKELLANGDVYHVMIKATAVLLFETIQHALQCGPLAGSKAGYWKRCGLDMAATGYSFLESIAPSAAVANAMHFTEKQTITLLKWKEGAKKVAESSKSPSKVVLQKCATAELAAMEARELNEKKKQRRLKANADANL